MVFVVNMLYIILFLYPFSETLISFLPISCPFVFLALKFLIQGGFFPCLKYFFESESVSHSVMFDSFQPHGL